jgi:DNA-binding transcriptional LysR family regulator
MSWQWSKWLAVWDYRIASSLRDKLALTPLFIPESETMSQIEDMRVFVAVAEQNGFAAAAETLGMSTPGVSRHVARLEAGLGVRLFNRTTRRVSLTTTGAAYYQRCLILLADFDELESSIREQGLMPTGTLRVNAPVSFGITKLAPVLAGFRLQFPDVRLDLTLTDRLTDMVEEGYDLAIRITRQPGPALIARKLAETRLLLCASPAYLERQGVPSVPADLVAHECLSYTYWGDGDNWRLSGPDGEVAIPITGGVQANNGDLLVQAARDGLGIVLQPDFLVAPDLSSGCLVEVLPDYNVARAGIYAVYASRNHLAPKVRAFIDYLVDAFA